MLQLYIGVSNFLSPYPRNPVNWKLQKGSVLFSLTHADGPGGWAARLAVMGGGTASENGDKEEGEGLG